MTLKVKEGLSPRYMTRFKCIGSDCEDNCCSGWDIVIEKKFYQKIERVLSRSQESRKTFTDKVQRLHGERVDKMNYAQFTQSTDGQCGFQGRAGLCSLQQSYGEEILPIACSTYPRISFIINERFERYGTLSCPEMARLCLLNDDALIFEDLDQPPTPNTLGNLVYIANNEKTKNVQGVNQHYENYFDDIRSTIGHLLALPEYSFESKMFFIVFFAIRSEGVFHDKIESDPLTSLRENIDYIHQKKHLDEITSLVSEIKCDLLPATKLALNILFTCESSYSINTKKYVFAKNIIDAINIYSGMSKSQVMTRAHDFYISQRNKITPHYQNELEQYLMNYTLNYWLSNPYTKSANLVIHTRKLLLRLNAIKFLFFCHPNIVQLASGDVIAGEKALIDKTIVEVVYMLGRVFEHSAGFQVSIEQEIEKDNVGLPLLAALLKY